MCTQADLRIDAGKPDDTRGHELRLHRRTRRAAQDRPRVPRGQEPRGGRPRADGDRGRLRRRGVVADGRADGPAGPAHPRGVRRVGLRLRRARHRARGDGPRAAVRAVLLVGRARRQHADPVRRRGRQEDVPARHRQRRDDRHARLHRAVGQVGRVGHHVPGHEGRATATRSPARRCSCSTATPPT